MQWFMDLKISSKLILSFVLVSLITIIVGYEGITSLRYADDSDTILYEKNVVPLGQLGDIGVAFQRQRMNTLELIISESPAIQADMQKRIQERDAEIFKNFDSFQKTILTAAGQDSLNLLRSAYTLNTFKHGKELLN